MSQRTSSGRSKGGTPATSLLDTAGVRYTLHSYQHDAKIPSFGTEASSKLGVPAERVFKTLMAAVTGSNGTFLVAAMVPVSESLDLKLLAAAMAAKKAELADPQLAQRRTGYVLGGISPLGSKLANPVVLDESALNLATLYFSAGRRGLEIELAPALLVELCQATVAPIGRKS
ncbi:Cys-tRNA(Pro) deacylase [Psychromicrobium lacuslunae]|uniref:Cys-tRNA(Pro)/Cys-tRNA(Cys) deacylase n=1 Tax=Psychromicrobium lacuslunae TaxID=1618207 RepID=A0A0D4BXF1_9MICC|nr:Cys-tRNA(Pro) deacylase [Psychromicrobium lacuslunae]AJT40801.1 hypothetical protein UM93_03415 [Psychromicrobium lacuslunae]